MFKNGSDFDVSLKGKTFTRTPAVEKHIAKIVELRKKQATVFEGKTVKQWGEHYNVHPDTIRDHMKRNGHLNYVGRKSGWAKPKLPTETLEEKKLRTTNLGKLNSKKCHTPDGIFASATNAAKFYGVDKSAIGYRIKSTNKKWSNWYYVEESA